MKKQNDLKEKPLENLDINVETPLEAALEKPTKNKTKSAKKTKQGKTLDTFLKNQNRLLMNSISIADKKAAILVRLNTTLVSSLIIFESYFEATANLSESIIPFLIVGLSLSLLFAILVAKPFSFSLYNILNNVIKSEYPKLEENNFFLIDKVPFAEYEESMEKVIQSQELQVGNLTRFNYFMSRSISQKFVMLEVAYGFFMITLVGVLVIYLFSKFVM